MACPFVADAQRGVTMQASGFIALLLGILGSRIVNERAYQKLDSNEKLRLMDGFSNVRAYSIVPLLVLMAVFWLLMTQTQLSRFVVTMGYFGALVLYIAIRTILNRRKLIELAMPASYRQSFMIAQVISLVGLAWFFFTIFFGQ